MGILRPFQRPFWVTQVSAWDCHGDSHDPLRPSWRPPHSSSRLSLGLRASTGPPRLLRPSQVTLSFHQGSSQGPPQTLTGTLSLHQGLSKDPQDPHGDAKPLLGTATDPQDPQGDPDAFLGTLMVPLRLSALTPTPKIFMETSKTPMRPPESSQGMSSLCSRSP